METTPKEQILKRIRQAVLEKTRHPYPNIDLDSQVFQLSGDDPVVDFAQQFTAAGGQFIYCTNKYDGIDQLLKIAQSKLWDKFFCKEATLLKLLADTGFKFTQQPAEISQTDAVISGCEKILFRSGSIVVSNATQPRRAIISSSIHIVIAFTSQLQRDLKEVFQYLKNNPEQKLPKWISVITGPSRTADIEKIPVIGVHGPKEIYCFLIEDRSPEAIAQLFE